MRTTKIGSRLSLLFLAFAVIMLAIPAMAFAQVADPASSSSTAPTIQSDKADYAPGELVTLTGSNWQDGESVRIVVDDDGLDPEKNWQHDVTVTADESGNITDQFNLPDWFVADYFVKATGSSGSVATTTFTDALPGQATVEPSSVQVGAAREFTIRITNTSTDQLGSARMQIPTGYTGVSIVANSVSTSSSTSNSPSGGWSATFDSTARKVNLSANQNSNRVGQNGWVQVRVNATAPTSTGSGEWTAEGWKNTDFTAVGNNANSVFSFSPQPIVSVTPACTAPSVATQPNNATITYGNNASFTAAASGNPSPSVQWQKSTDAGATWNNISGATSTTLSVTKPSVSESGNRYRAAFTNSCGNATSNAVALTINQKSVTGSFTAANKTYDGTTSASITGRSLAAADKVGNDDVNLIGGTATFADKNAGENKTVTATSFELAGLDSGNYTLAAGPWTAQASINKAELTVTAEDKDKTYGQENPANTVRYSGFVTGDTPANSVSGNATFAYSKNGSAVANPTNVGAYEITPGGLTSSNYNITFATGTLNISPKALTVTADAREKVYGEADPALTYQITSGSLVRGDAFSGSLSRVAGESVTGSPYAIQRGTLSAGSNYDLTFVGANLTINKANPSVSINWTDSIYDGTANSASGSVKGVGTPAEDLGQPNFTYFPGANTTGTPLLGAPKDAGIYTVKASFSGNGNYTAKDATKTITIAKAALAVKADDESRKYGEANPTFTGSIVSGLKNNDDLSVSASSAATQSSPIGSYDIVPVLNGAAKDNYEVTAQSGTLTVTRAPLTVNTDNKSKTYGDANPELTGSIVGIKNRDNITASRSTEATASSPVKEGGYAITATLSDPDNRLSNYNVTNNGGKLTINERPITVSADPKSKVYGAADPALTYQVTSGSLAAGDTPASVFSGSLIREAGQNVGSYAITQGTLAANGNYNLTFVGANLTINRANPTVEINWADATYDGSTHPASGSVKGIGTPAEDLGQPSFTYYSGTTATGTPLSSAPVNANQYTVKASFGGNSNYNAAEATRTITIAKANATVTLSNLDQTYDGTVKAPTATTTPGNLNISFAYSQNGVAVTPKDAGTYDVVATIKDDNYQGSDRGTLVIAQKSVTGSFTAANKTYDGTTSASITGRSLAAADKVGNDDVNLIGGTATFADKNVGSAKTVTGSGFSLTGVQANNYLLSMNDTTTANITEAPLTISAVSQTKVYDGTTASTGTPTVSGLKGGDTVTGLTQAFQSKNVMGLNGSTLVVPGYTVNDGNSGGNYNVTTQPASGTITKAPLTVEPNPKTPSRQYSDPNPAFSPSYTGFVSGETEAVLGTEPTCSSAATSSSAPGLYAITCSGGVDSNYSFSYQAGQLNVTKEDADAEFSGATYYSTPTAGGSVTVTLTAVITDADDGSRGDVRNAKVSFVNRDAAGQPAFTNCANRPVGLVTPGDTTVGTATCTTTMSAGTSQTAANLYTVGIVVDNNYIRNDSEDNAVVTVAQSVAGSITGGGFLVNELSGGQYAGDAGQKTNFGFNVRLEKTGPKGQINTIVRRGGRVYQIKGNAMTSLTTKIGTATTPGTATFNGKANIQDITNPLVPVSIDGNASLQVTMTDKGTPGSSDTIGITLWDKNGGLWFSSRWVSPNTVEQLLKGGNLTVR